MCLLARGVADVVLPGTYELHELDAWMARPPDDQAPVIRTVSTRVQVPEIVRLRSYDRVPVREAAFSKRNLYIRDQARCQYCGKEPGWSRLTVDHIVPRSRGGDTSWENCVVACKACNNTKGDRTPKEAGLTLDTAPRRPLWRSFLQGIKPKPSWQPFVARGRA
jgi:5-methylcytosine-specific restriction endonuclease McrA